ncbi:MAG: acyl-CoA synthetase, partial [Parvibaculum sp.]
MSLAEDTGGPAPFKPLKQKPPKITVKRNDAGAIYISSDHPLPEMKRSVPHILEERAGLHPDRNFIA